MTAAGKQSCTQCGEESSPVHRTTTEVEPGRVSEELATPVFRGWFCAYCGHFEPATGREHGLGVEVKR